MRHLVALLALGTVPVSQAHAQEATRSAVQVKVHRGSREAFEAVREAFQHESLTISQSNVYAGSVISSPVRRGGGFVQLSLTYRATISPAGDSAAIVLLNGTYTFGAPSATLTVDQRPITSPPSPYGPLAHIDAWAPIQRMADWLELHYGEAGKSP